MLSQLTIKTATENTVHHITHWTPVFGKPPHQLIDHRKLRPEKYVKGLQVVQIHDYSELRNAVFVIPISTKRDGWIFISQDFETKRFILIFEGNGMKHYRTFDCQTALENMVYSVKFGVFFGVETDRLHVFSDVVVEMNEITNHSIPEDSTYLLFDDDLRRLFSGGVGRILSWKFDLKWNPTDSSLPNPNSLLLPEAENISDLIPRIIESDYSSNQLMVSTKNCLFVFSLMTWNLTHIIPREFLSCALFHDSTQLIFLGEESGKMSLLDTSNMETTYEDKLHTAEIIGAEILGNFPFYVVSGDHDGALISWDLGPYCVDLLPGQAISRNSSVFMNNLDENSLFCKVSNAVVVLKLEAFGICFASFPSSVLFVDSICLNGKSCISAYTMKGIWVVLDSQTGKPNLSLALPGDEHFNKKRKRESTKFGRSVPSVDTGAFDPKLNLFYALSPNGSVIEYDCSDVQGKVTVGGAFKSNNPSLGEVTVFTTIYIPEKNVGERCFESSENDLLIICGHTSGKFSMLSARRACHFKVDSQSLIAENSESEGLEIVSVASSSDDSCNSLLTSANGRREVIVWTVSYDDTMEANAPHLSTILLQKEFKYRIGGDAAKHNFDLKNPPILCLAFNRLWVFLKEMSSQSPPVECHLKDDMDGTIDVVKGRNVDDSIVVTSVNVITSCKAFITLDTLDTFRVWQVTSLEDFESESSIPIIFLTREIRIEGLAESISSFCIIDAFCYYAVGQQILVVDPEEMFRNEQIYAMCTNNSTLKYNKRCNKPKKGGGGGFLESDQCQKSNLLSDGYYKATRKSLSKIIGDPFNFIERCAVRLRRSLHASHTVILYELNISKAQLVIYTNNVTYNITEGDNKEVISEMVVQLGEVATFAEKLLLNIDVIFLSTIWDRKNQAERALLYTLGREIFQCESPHKAQEATSQPFDIENVIPEEARAEVKLQSLDLHLKALALQYSLSPPVNDESDAIFTESEKKLLKIVSLAKWPIAPDGFIPNSMVRKRYLDTTSSNNDSTLYDKRSPSITINSSGVEEKIVASGSKRLAFTFRARRKNWQIEGIADLLKKDDSNVDNEELDEDEFAGSNVEGAEPESIGFDKLYSLERAESSDKLKQMRSSSIVVTIPPLGDAKDDKQNSSNVSQYLKLPYDAQQSALSRRHSLYERVEELMEESRRASREFASEMKQSRGSFPSGSLASISLKRESSETQTLISSDSNLAVPSGGWHGRRSFSATNRRPDFSTKGKLSPETPRLYRLYERRPMSTNNLNLVFNSSLIRLNNAPPDHLNTPTGSEAGQMRPYDKNRRYLYRSEQIAEMVKHISLVSLDASVIRQSGAVQRSGSDTGDRYYSQHHHPKLPATTNTFMGNPITAASSLRRQALLKHSVQAKSKLESSHRLPFTTIRQQGNGWVNLVTAPPSMTSEGEELPVDQKMLLRPVSSSVPTMQSTRQAAWE